MCKTKNWKTGILVIALALVCGSANAQHWRRYNPYHPDRVVTVVVRPDVTSHVSNRFNQKERLAMAVAYLETHKYLTIKQYAKMTRLSKTSAEASLTLSQWIRKSPYNLSLGGKRKFILENNRI